MPEPGQEEPFLFGSFFPVSAPHPSIRPSIPLCCPTAFSRDFFSLVFFPFPEIQLQPDKLAGALGLFSSSAHTDRHQPQLLECGPDRVLRSPVQEPSLAPLEPPKQLHTSGANLAPLQRLLAFAPPVCLSVCLSALPGNPGLWRRCLVPRYIICPARSTWRDKHAQRMLNGYVSLGRGESACCTCGRRAQSNT